VALLHLATCHAGFLISLLGSGEEECLLTNWEHLSGCSVFVESKLVAAEYYIEVGR
jgi:hypothetical protein